MKKEFKALLILCVMILLFFICYFFLGNPPESENIIWGVIFSQKHSSNLDLDWKENYLALIEDLKVKNIKLLTHWDLIEPQKDKYFFEDLDWQIQKAEEKGVKIFLVLGMKTGRWPECHIPDWARTLKKEEQQREILELVQYIIEKYKDSASITRWQVENEPFFPFGDCPWTDESFVKEEIEKVKSLDSKKRPIVLTDSGEGSLWISAARLGDIIGTTMYKKVWFSFSWEKRVLPFLPEETGFYVSYPFPPVFYWRKAQYINRIFNKKVIVTELQAEPWGPKLLYDIPLEEQKKTMNLEQFKYNIEFAKKTGLNEFYLWGAEWWYWMKTEQGQSQVWEEAKKLF